MGDEERSMEAEQEMKTVVHCPPICPLPDEIKKMEPSETVCRYCGVSYLIFHEFQQLHTQLARLEAELRELIETAQREKDQREALELGRLEWERALRLEVQRQAEEKEKRTREELEIRSRDAERALRDEFEQRIESNRREMEEEEKEKERQLRRELADLEGERLREQREDLERRTGERERLLRDALLEANRNSEELRENLQQLAERLAVAVSEKEEAERSLEKEKERDEILSGVCAQQQQALLQTLSTLRSSAGELTAVRGFLRQITGAWQAFRSDMLHRSTQVFSVLREELKQSSVGFQKVREENEHLTQQLREQGRRREEQLSQLQERRDDICRLQREVGEKHERWLSCQQRCEALEEQLLSWRQRGEQINRTCRAAEEEVTQLREALEKVQQETRQLRRERVALLESHDKALNTMEENFRQQMASKLAAAVEEQRTQNALHLREQAEELRREAELELTIDREKNQLLLEQYQRDATRFQQRLQERERELQGLQDELQGAMRSRVEERRRMREELQQCQQEEALQLSQAKAELLRVTESNSELREEVVLLQETVRRECEEREGLTAALSEAQEELLGRRSHHGSVRSPSHPTERHSLQAEKNSHHRSQSELPLRRSFDSPNTLPPRPAGADGDGGRGAGGGEAWGRSASRSHGGVLGGEGRRTGTLARLKVSKTANKVKQKVNAVMERKGPL